MKDPNPFRNQNVDGPNKNPGSNASRKGNKSKSYTGTPGGRDNMPLDEPSSIAGLRK